MKDLKSTLISSIQAILNNNLNGCTLYKLQYNSPQSLGISSGSVDTCYIFKKQNTPKIAIFVGIDYPGISFTFYKYKENSDGEYSKKYLAPLFDEDKIEQIIQHALEQIEF